jgi:hypothetical protein
MLLSHRSGTANKILEEKEKARAKESSSKRGEPSRKRQKRYAAYILILSKLLTPPFMQIQEPVIRRLVIL